MAIQAAVQQPVAPAAEAARAVQDRVDIRIEVVRWHDDLIETKMMSRGFAGDANVPATDPAPKFLRHAVVLDLDGNESVEPVTGTMAQWNACGHDTKWIAGTVGQADNLYFKPALPVAASRASKFIRPA